MKKNTNANQITVKISVDQFTFDTIPDHVDWKTGRKLKKQAKAVTKAAKKAITKAAKEKKKALNDQKNKHITAINKAIIDTATADIKAAFQAGAAAVSQTQDDDDFVDADYTPV